MPFVPETPLRHIPLASQPVIVLEHIMNTSDHRPGRGPLRNGNHRGNPNAAPRCGAKTRAFCPCKGPAMPNGRCRMHGGARHARTQRPPRAAGAHPGRDLTLGAGRQGPGAADPGDSADRGGRRLIIGRTQTRLTELLAKSPVRPAGAAAACNGAGDRGSGEIAILRTDALTP